MKMNKKGTALALLMAAPGLAPAASEYVAIEEQPDGSFIVTLPSLPAASPGAALGTPMAYGAKWGQVYAGLAGTDGVGNITKTDGSMVVGFGLGDPDRTMGVDVTISNYSLQSNFGDNGGINLMAHRSLGDTTAVAFGIENAYNWGPETDAPNIKPTLYVVGSTVISLLNDKIYNPNRLTLSLGVGNGHYQKAAFTPTTPNVDMHKIGVFGSVGYQFHEQMSVVASYTGKDVNAGVSFVPLRNQPLTVTLGYVDLLNENQPESRFVGTIGYSWKF